MRRFFFASSGASAAYLTVSEIFPLEARAKAIVVFFAIAQSFGAFGPWIYGRLIGNGQDRFKLFIGYLIGAAVMIVGGLVAAALGVAAEGKVTRGHCQPALLRQERGVAGTRRRSSSTETAERWHLAGTFQSNAVVETHLAGCPCGV